MKKVLVVVDFQNDFVTGSLAFSEAKDLEPVIVNKIDEYLNSGHDLIFTLDTHDENYLETSEGKSLPIVHCIKGTFGHKLYGRVNDYYSKAIKVIEKDAFGSLELAEVLKTNNYDSVEICGLVTNMCVISNAIIAKSALPEATVIVDRKASDSFNKDLHEKTFDLLEGVYVKII